jgi:hypothetical protein
MCGIQAQYNTNIMKKRSNQGEITNGRRGVKEGS